MLNFSKVGLTEPISIGYDNVAEQNIPNGLYCRNCDTLLAVSFEALADNATNIWYCSSCAAAIGCISDTIGIVTGQPGYACGLPNVPSEQDVVRLNKEDSYQEQLAFANRTADWCRDQRQKSTEKKVSKLLAER